MPTLRNARHERFAQEVAKGKTAGDAYALAGYSPNPKNADRLKKNEGILSRIAEIQNKAAAKVGVTVEAIINELAKIGFADITKAVEWGEALAIKTEDGAPAAVQGVALIASADLPPEVSAAISEVRKTKDGISIKFHDKQAALVNLGKHIGMFKDRIEHSGPDGAALKNETTVIVLPSNGREVP